MSLRWEQDLIGFTVGTDLAGRAPFDTGEAAHVRSAHGRAVVHRGAGWALIMRHGESGDIPPHRINHHANIACLADLGVRRLVALCSVGSLRAELRPGTLVVPDDYVNLFPVLSFFQEQARHVTPELSEELRVALVRALEQCGERFVEGGTYFQTIGPRLETRAEVAMLAQFAHVVGMTFGHEATLCNELGIEVAVMCSVDNMAHGLGGAERLDARDIARAKIAQAERWCAIAGQLLADDQASRRHD